MEARNRRRGERDGGGMMVAALVPIALSLLLFLYVLSCGPVIRFCILTEHESIFVIYAPLEWLCTVWWGGPAWLLG